MRHYIGLDVSNKETVVCIVNESGKVIKTLKVMTDPDNIADVINKLKLQVERIGLETGSLTHWIVEGLKKHTLPVICIDARRMAAIISSNINKTDNNDAKEIAQAMRTGNYREVYHKSKDSVDKQVLMTARTAVVEEMVKTKNTIRGLLKTYGIKLKSNLKDKRFVEEVEGQLSWDNFSPETEKRSTAGFKAIRSLLSIFSKQLQELEDLEKEVEALCTQSALIKRYTAMPGIGPITALSYIIDIDDPRRFKYSRSVGAYFGCTPWQRSSGETIRQGSISKCGPKETRRLLIRAGLTILTHTTKWSKLKAFGMRILRKTGSKMVAAVAIARKLAIIMHRMWIDESEFEFGTPQNKKELSETEKLQNFALSIKKKKTNKKEKVA